MERSERTHGSEGPMDQSQSNAAMADELSPALPRRLADFLAGLAYLTPTGRQLALERLGPGSRLLLEALRLVETGERGGLTERGRLVSEHLAERRPDGPPVPADEQWPGGGLVRIARITPVSERDLLAAATEERQRKDNRNVTYELSPDRGAAEATIEVTRVRNDYWLWQRSGSGEVVVVDTMEALPTKGEPLVLANPGGEAPSQLLRTKLAFTRGDRG